MTADVIDEVIVTYEKDNIIFDNVACIYSTAPFVTYRRLQEAFAMINNGIDSVFTVVAFSYPIQRSLRIQKGRVLMNYPQYAKARSQDLETIYHDAGQFYIATMDAYKKMHGFWGENTSAKILSELEVQDLDTLTDWKLAEMKYKLLRGE
jgi:pseudaminic acid cytidylyltransferase